MTNITTTEYHVDALINDDQHYTITYRDQHTGTLSTAHLSTYADMRSRMATIERNGHTIVSYTTPDTRALEIAFASIKRYSTQKSTKRGRAQTIARKTARALKYAR